MTLWLFLALLASPCRAGTGLAGGSVQLNGQARTNIRKTKTINTTALTGNGVSVLAYTATAGTTFYVTYFELEAAVATVSSTPIMGATITGNPVYINIGSGAVFADGGVAIASHSFVVGAGAPNEVWRWALTEPIPIPGNTVFQTTVNANVTNATNWILNFGGYER